MTWNQSIQDHSIFTEKIAARQSEIVLSYGVGLDEVCLLVQAHLSVRPSVVGVNKISRSFSRSTDLDDEARVGGQRLGGCGSG